MSSEYLYFEDVELGDDIGPVTKIVNDEQLLDKNPDYILLLAWHLSQPIIDKWRKKGIKSKFIIPLPEVKIV